jgi:ABC-type glycerol-3-phosphate transport system substrate-binding protein
MRKLGGIKIGLVLLLVSSLFLATGCTKGGSTNAIAAYKSVKLEYWSVWNDESDIKPLINAYRRLHPNVSINYNKYRFDEYENKLLEAMAEDRGPDVFSIHNTWVKKYQSRLTPSPTSVSLPVKYMTGTVKKEEVVEFRTTKMLNANDVEKQFLDVVAGDVVHYQNIGDAKTPNFVKKVYGLPLSVDTLVLYYNRDLLNNAGIITPPATWTEFSEQVKKITKIDQETGEIILSGAAIGAADNVLRSFDVLSLLMMQNLAPMVDSKGRAAFDKTPNQYPDIKIPPALGALDFYVQFASPLYEGYSWNSEMPNSLDSFIKGQTAFFFGYSYNKEEIESKAPKMNFKIAPVPQVGDDQKVNYANYWVETVSNKTEQNEYAWDFIKFITDEKNVEAYLDETNKPTALRSTKLINKQLADPEMEAFADQLLTAKSWYKGYNATAAEEAFKEMINGVLDGTFISEMAIKNAVSKVNRSILYK